MVRCGILRYCTLVAGAVSLLTLTPRGESMAQQTATVSGTVTLGQAGEGVPGVRVWLPELGLGRMTDTNGVFRFGAVSAGKHEMHAEFVDCQAGSWTVRVGAASQALHLWLDGPAVAALRERVAAGTATAISASELPFTVDRLGRKDLDRGSARVLADLLRGRFPGIKVVQGSGMPGEPISIRFRGPTSMAGDREPLIVVDGAITEGGVDDLDPLDIEKVEILKGAAAAAVYGARGEAGAVEITTRRGTPAPPRCFFSSESS